MFHDNTRLSLSFGGYLSMCFTGRKEKAYIPWRIFLPAVRVAHGCAQEPAPGTTTLFGFETLAKKHALVTWQNIAGSGDRGLGGECTTVL